MNLNSNDEVITFLYESGYPTEYNDGLLAWLRDIFQSELTLPDLLHRYKSTYGNEIMANSVVEKSAIRIAGVHPAATFVSSVPSNDGSGNTTLTSAGVHGLTTTVVVTPGDVGIYISAGSNWIPGLYTILALDVDTTGVAITIDYPFDASLGSPTIALPSTEIQLTSVPIPPLAPNSYIELDHSFFNPNSGNTKTHRAKLNTTAFTAFTSTTNITYRTNILISNRGVTNSQFGSLNAASNVGLGSGGAAPTTGTVDTSVSTQIVYTTQSTAANEVIGLDRYIVKLSV